MWSQTPQFDLSLDSVDDIGIDMNVHHGVIKSLTFKDARISKEHQEVLQEALVDHKLQDIRNWTEHLQSCATHWDEDLATFARRLDTVMPIPQLSKR
jgi:lipoate-protein ligase A